MLSEVSLLIAEENPTAAFWKHPRFATLSVLGLAVAVATAPLIFNRGATWLIAWSDISVALIGFATALRCFATSRRLGGQERTTWFFVSAAYISFALAQTGWSIYELVLGIPNPIGTPADIVYLSAPPLLIIGIWFYRTNHPTRAAAWVELGNLGILVAAIFLANRILFSDLLEASGITAESPSLLSHATIGMAAFIFALFNICFYMRGRRQLVMMPLLLALAAIAVSDYLSLYEFAAAKYSSASYGNLGYFFAVTSGYWAAFEQDQLRDVPDLSHAAREIDEVARQWETLLPPLAIAGLMAVALTHPEKLTVDIAPHAAGALLLFIAAIALRDWWSQRIEIQLREETRTGAALLHQSERSLLEKNDELLAANRELSKEVTARRHVEDELRHSQKLEAIGQLTGGVAHDFNNLLAVILGNAELLEQTLEPKSSQRIYTQEVTAAAKRGAALTGRLLAFSRKQSLDPRPIEVNRLLRSMTGLLERSLGERIQLRIELGADVAPCMIDAAQLENAILNLVINARDAMPNGGLITIEASNFSLAARGIADHPEGIAGDCVSIAVRDTGTGMSGPVRARAFDPFFTTKDPSAGSGLGLSMVYGFAKQSGGHVSIESEVGYGTEVRLYIPQTNLAPDPIEDADAREVPAGRGESVLVVEDDSALRAVIVSFLAEKHYRVESAGDGSEALATLGERGPFDLLLSDVILPGKYSGPDLADEIARQQPSIKILLMSGYASDALESKANFPRYANLIQKPFGMSKLARRIRSALQEEEETPASFG